MSGIRREVDDAIDASLEMPPQYGSRTIWRYFQVKGLVGLVALPILAIMSLFNPATTIGFWIGVAGIAAILFSIFYFIRRDIWVQKRLDETGSPLIDREPY